MDPSIARTQRGLVTRDQARAAGLTDGAIDGRLARGRWQRVLPRVLLTQPRTLDDDDRAVAALLYAGWSATLTAHVALRCHGVRYVPRSGLVTVVVPAGASVRSRAWVRVMETARPWPRVVTTELGRTMPVPRTLGDLARMTASLAVVRSTVADALQRDLCQLEPLERELEDGPRRGSALLRVVLAEVGLGARSAPEAQLLAAIRSTGLPPPRVNEPLVVAGRVVAVPDLCWPQVRLIVEVDSREWHLSPADWERTMRRHNRLQRLGFIVLHVPPSRIARDLEGVLAEITATYWRLRGNTA